MKTIENLELCTRLTELWFGKNKIARLEGMSTLKNLKILSIQSNRITKLEGLEELESLEELYISHNGIKKLEGLDKNVSGRISHGYDRRLKRMHASSISFVFWTSATTSSRRSRISRI